MFLQFYILISQNITKYLLTNGFLLAIIYIQGGENMDYANIILEMLDRIKKLETEVEKLKQSRCEEKNESGENHIPKMPMVKSSDFITPLNKRDTTRYMFEGNVYLKNRLVLAVVQKYVKENPSVARAELKQIFSKSLQGSIGVVENVEIATSRHDCDVRFFTKDNEIIRLNDGDMYVCNQWGVLNIPNFIKMAGQIGYNIEAI